MSLTRGPVVLDIQALQSPDFRGRGIARYAYELATALERDHPELVGAYLLNPDLPPPGDLGPLLGSAKVDYADSPTAVHDGARLLHVLSPFELQVPIDRVWPRWAHEAGLRFCATVYDLIPLEHQHPYLDDVRQRARYLGRLEALRARTRRSRSHRRRAGRSWQASASIPSGYTWWAPARAGDSHRQLPRRMPGHRPRSTCPASRPPSCCIPVAVTDERT